MHLTRQSSSKLTPLALALAAAMASAPAFAETEIEALKREVAEQRALIQQLMDMQTARSTQSRQAAQETKDAPQKLDVQTGGPNRGSGLQAGVPTGPAIPSLTIYGVADVNVSHADSGYGAKTNAGSGGMTASRLGFKGEQSLGHQVKAVYLMEAGLSTTTGAAGTGTPPQGINNTAPSNGALTSGGTQFFSRQIYAGLDLPVGTFSIGRQYAGSYLASVSAATSMGAGLYGSSATLLPVVTSMPTRLNNSLVYTTPKFANLNAQLTLTSGVGNNVRGVSGTPASSTTDQSGRGGDLAIFYAAGPAKAAVTAWHVRNASFNPSLGETGLATRKGFQLGGNVELGVARLYGTYVHARIGGGGYELGTKSLSNVTGWGLSAGIPLAGGTVLASYTRVNDKSLIPDKDAKLAGLAYTYKLQEPTTLYASWGKLLNGRNAAYSLADGGDLVGVSVPGYQVTGFMLGLNQVF